MAIRAGINMLSEVSSVALGNHFSKILEKVNKDIEHLESFKKKPSWQEIDEQLNAINKKHAKKDADGKYVTDNGNHVFTDPEKWQAEVDEFEKKKADIFVERKRLLEEYKALLEVEYEDELPKIPYSLIVAIEKDYKEAKQLSPFKSGLITLIWPVVDEEK